MRSQIVITFIILFLISFYLLKKNSNEELIGSTKECNKNCAEGEKSFINNKINVIKWTFNKEYRRGYIKGLKK